MLTLQMSLPCLLIVYLKKIKAAIFLVSGTIITFLINHNGAARFHYKILRKQELKHEKALLIFPFPIT